MIATDTPSARAAAGVATAIVLLAVLAGFLPVLAIGIGEGTARIDRYLLQVAGFTILQAGLSTLLSVAAGIPVARALARRRFPGRGLVLRLFALPLALPSIVVILGIVEVYGARGWLGGIVDLYGLTGILLAHVFFNFPLAARILLAHIEAIPPESFRLAAQLDFSGRDLFRLIEWPQIRTSLPGLAMLIFLLCAASFAVVLTLGGGPQATTLEVAIYQALRFDFDPARAASLALAQMAICAILVLASQQFAGTALAWPAIRTTSLRRDGRSMAARLGDAGIIGAGLILLVPPMIAILHAGLASFQITDDLVRAILTSLAVGSAAALTSLALSWPLAHLAARQPTWRGWFGLLNLAALILPPAVMATGWFILLSRFAGNAWLAPVLVVAMNALTAMPFVYNNLAPALSQEAAANDRLCASLGLAGLNRFRVIDLPALRRPIGLALLMGGIVSLGDLTAITLFGSQDFVTLPSLIYRQMGSYRMQAAATSALILAVLALIVVAISERWSRGDDPA